MAGPAGKKGVVPRPPAKMRKKADWTPPRSMLKGPVAGQRKQTAGPATGAQKGLGKYRAATASAVGLPTAASTARRRAKNDAQRANPGFDIGKALNDLLPTRGASSVVPRTLKTLPPGGVKGVVNRAKR